jgi:hypothetical protein
MLASGDGLADRIGHDTARWRLLRKGACLRAFCAMRSRDHAASITVDAEPTATERRERKVRELSDCYQSR